MTGQQLKNSILQIAVQGKLVPQDPNDEPASVLLERIRKEKEQLIKEGKIKTEKNPSYIFRGADNLPYEKIGKNDPVCIDDEVPFDIPDSWEWVRLNFVCQLTDGIKIENRLLHNLDAKYLRGKSEGKTIGFGKYVEKGTYLILVDGENSGEVFIAPENGYMGSTFKVLWMSSNIYREYLLQFLDFHRTELKNSKKGAAIPHLNKNLFFNLLLPVPPYYEQKRILEKLKELYPLVDKYRKNEEKITKVIDDFPDLLKKSILQEAVQGKLVPQDENDEPASVLLERIRAEKQKLIAEGKIKKDKHESVIFRRDNSHYEKRGSEEVCIDDEIPFEVPRSWALIRLDDIGIYRKGPFGSSLTKSIFVPKGDNTIKVYEQKNAIQKDHTLGTYYITREYYESKMRNFTVEPGDILVSCAGTIGETYVLPERIELGIINQALMRMTIYAPINLDYFLLYFDYVLKQTAKESSKGSAIKNIPPFEIFKKLILPLPPIEEQKRIVEKVRELEYLCNVLHA